MTIRLADDRKERPNRLAESTNRSKSFLAAEAVCEFVDINEWQVAEVCAALNEAEAGEFATDAQVVAIAQKWKLNARLVAAPSDEQPRRRSRPHCAR